MLSRTADHLFWMARYTERAENTARMLDVNYQTSLLPQSAEVAEQGWWAMLDISELTRAFDHKYGLLTRDDEVQDDVGDRAVGRSDVVHDEVSDQRQVIEREDRA